MIRQSACLGLLALACLMPLEGTSAQGKPDPWYGRQAKPKDIAAPRTFPGMFSIELPKKWQLAPGHTGTVFSIVEKTRGFEAGALISLRYVQLQAPLEPALIEGASERELREAQSRELSGKAFTNEVKNGPSGPFIVIHYNRPGLYGNDNHVVQYSIPVGTTLYRLVCVAPAATIEKYRPLFAHVAASFTPVSAGGT